MEERVDSFTCINNMAYVYLLFSSYFRHLSLIGPVLSWQKWSHPNFVPGTNFCGHIFGLRLNMAATFGPGGPNVAVRFLLPDLVPLCKMWSYCLVPIWQQNSVLGPNKVAIFHPRIKHV